MTIRHHLTDALTMAYAAGQVPEALSLVIAAHVSLCDECRARLEACEAVGGAMLDDVGPAPMASGSLEATLARIGATPPAAPPPRRRPAAARAGIFPAPLRDYVGGDLEAVRWRGVGGGVAQAILPTSREATVRLLRIPGGTAVPDHGHRGIELTLVLAGAFRDAGGRYGRGDVAVAGEDDRHTPVAEPGDECICLSATEGPLRFTALLPRLAQPFLRI